MNDSTSDSVTDAARLHTVGRTSQATSEAPAICGATEATEQAAAPAVGAAASVVPDALDQDDPGSFSSVKSRRDLEAFLRAHGCPRAAAKAITAGGWPALKKTPDQHATDALKALLQAQIERLNDGL